MALCIAGCPGPSSDDPQDGGEATSTSSASTTGTQAGPDATGSGSEAGSGTSPSTTNSNTTVDPPGTTTEPTGEDASETEEPEQSGMQLYFGTCLPCHGVDARGTEFGYQVRQPVRDYSTWVIRNGRPGVEFPAAEMIAYDEEMFSDEDLTKIFDFLDTFERPMEPEVMYFELCSNCHGKDMAGGFTGVSLLGTDLATNMPIVRSGADLDNLGSRMTYMPAYDEAMLSDEELMQMVALFNE
jgi:mono/diheme cytochrome c family protein